MVKLQSLVLILCVSLSANARQAPLVQPAEDEFMFNIKTQTLGGKQFWTDHVWRKGWRIQQNAITGHWRLLDTQNVRHAWGNREECLGELDRQVPEATLAATEAVVLLHGLIRSSSSMSKLGGYLQTHSNLYPIYFEYASTRSSISDHAQAFAEFIDSLPPDLPLNFVAHSMGNIVLRHYFGDLVRTGQSQKLSRFRSFVMLGPPNQGAAIARQLSKTGLFGWIAGKGGLELGPGWEEFQTRLATPPIPFGIIAGKLPESVPANPLSRGEGDFVVQLEETRLEGASATLEVPRLHSFLMDAPEVQEATLKFIRSRSKFE